MDKQVLSVFPFILEQRTVAEQWSEFSHFITFLFRLLLFLFNNFGNLIVNLFIDNCFV